jgi:hypothetical protein
MELSGYREGRRVDIVFSPEYIYADGRGQKLQTEKIVLANSAVILKDRGALWFIPIDEQDEVSFRQDVLGLSGSVTIEGCNRDGEVLDSAVDYTIKDGWVTVALSDEIFKYRLTTD